MDVITQFCSTWWRHQMETFSASLDICAGNSPVTGEFPHKRPVIRSFDVFFDLGLNKRLVKQSRRRWFETPSGSLMGCPVRSENQVLVPAIVCIILSAVYVVCAVVCKGHCSDVTMSTMASQITSLMIVYSTVDLGADQRKHQSSASLAFVREIHRWPGNSPHKGLVTRKMFPFDDVIVV